MHRRFEIEPEVVILHWCSVRIRLDHLTGESIHKALAR
jgi:hypothetical protein